VLVNVKLAVELAQNLRGKTFVTIANRQKTFC